MNILWIVDQQFDSHFHVAPRIQMAKCLQSRHSLFFVAGYGIKKVQFPELKNDVIYIRSLRLPYLKRMSFYYFQIVKFINIIKKCKPEILIFNTNNLLLLKIAIALKTAFRFKLFLDIRTLPVFSNNIRNFLEEYLLKKILQMSSRNFDGITYITDEMRRYCIEKYHLTEHRNEIWSSGVDEEHFKSDNKYKEDGIFRIIYHGVVTRERGLQNVVKAITMTEIKDIKFTIFGDGTGMEEIRKLVEEFDIKDKIELLSPVPYDDVPYYINQADIGIIPLPNWPGWNVSSPIKLFEYLACCKPVIVTKIPAHTSVLLGKDFAFWAESSAPQDIAQAIQEAFFKKDEFKSLGKEAREFVIANYTWKQQAQRFEKFIKS